MLAGVAGALGTYELKARYGFTPVKASAYVSLFFGLVFYLGYSIFDPIKPDLSALMAFAAMGGSFVAMSSEHILPDRKWNAFSSIFMVFIYTNSSQFFSGFGGALGTSACLSVVITVGLIWTM